MGRAMRRWPAALVVAAAAGSARADDARPSRLRLNLRERTRAVSDFDSLGAESRTRLAVSGPTGSREPLSAFGLHVGELSLDVTLDRGRFSDLVQTASGWFRVRVRSRGGRLTASVRAEGAGAGTVLGRTCVLEAGFGMEGATASLHGLVEASAVA